jgi:hypothetical protein
VKSSLVAASSYPDPHETGGFYPMRARLPDLFSVSLRQMLNRLSGGAPASIAPLVFRRENFSQRLCDISQHRLIAKLPFMISPAGYQIGRERPDDVTLRATS